LLLLFRPRQGLSAIRGLKNEGYKGVDRRGPADRAEPPAKPGDDKFYAGRRAEFGQKQLAGHRVLGNNIALEYQN